MVVNDTDNVLGGLPQSADPDATKDSAHTLTVDGDHDARTTTWTSVTPPRTPPLACLAAA